MYCSTVSSHVYYYYLYKPDGLYISICHLPVIIIKMKEHEGWNPKKVTKQGTCRNDIVYKLSYKQILVFANTLATVGMFVIIIQLPRYDVIVTQKMKQLFSVTIIDSAAVWYVNPIPKN